MASNFSAFSRDLPVHVRSTGFLSSAVFSNSLSWASSFFHDLVSLSVCWTRGSHYGCWANGLSLSLSLSPADVDVFVLLQERKREPRVISGRTRRWVFSCLSCRATRRRPGTSIEKMPRTNSKAEVAVAAEIALLRFRRHFSPWLFETSGRCHSIMPSLFILFIQCWKIQFILSNN